MKETVFLIIHGFGGDTSEIDYLYRFLVENHLNVDTVLLSGHGKSKKELRKSEPKDWINSVEKKINSLTLQYTNIVLIGFSMGGLIGTRFTHIPHIKKMVFINTPVYFWNIKVIVKDIFTSLKNKNLEQIKYYGNSLFGTSLKSGIDFLKLLHSSKRLFVHIKTPLLVLQCKNDESVRYKSAAYISNHTSLSKMILYDGGCHQVFKKSPGLRDRVCRDIHMFLTAE